MAVNHLAGSTRRIRTSDLLPERGERQHNRFAILAQRTNAPGKGCRAPGQAFCWTWAWMMKRTLDSGDALLSEGGGGASFLKEVWRTFLDERRGERKPFFRPRFHTFS